MRINTLFLILLSAFLLPAMPTPVWADSPANGTIKTPHTLYLEGDIEGARRGFKEHVAEARQSDNKRLLWSSLMHMAWFEDEVSNHRPSIELSNEALEIASSINEPYLIGRSLCWLGWAYSSLGLYDLALSFYENAVEIGAPGGTPQIIPVWGLASQEIGAIRFKTGDTAGALAKLNETYEFAKKAEIDVGIAEGGAHLAEIFLATGKYAEAEQYALEAISAANRCGCSPFNSARARMVSLKVALDKSSRNSELKPTVFGLADELEIDCKKQGLPRCQAEAKLIKSQTLDKADFEKRFELVEAAFRILADNESELRGTAEAELGRVFLDDNKEELASFYLRNGLKVNEELFRKVDAAHTTLDLAYLAGVIGEKKMQIEKLIKSNDAAMQSHALPLALKAQVELCDIYQHEKQKGLALHWCTQTYETLRKLEEANLNSEEFKDLDEAQLTFAEKVVNLRLELGVTGKPKLEQ